jgi:hypothetical protein
LEVIKTPDDAAEIPDAIAVRILERAWVDLIDDALAPPIRGSHLER